MDDLLLDQSRAPLQSPTSARLGSVGTLAERDRRPTQARPILIVDDDPSSRLLITACIAELGLSNPTIELGDGAQAIVGLKRYIDGAGDSLPVLVLLDPRMPRCSGKDFIGWMRETPELARIPVIVLSGDDDAKSVTMMYRLGVRSYLVKPVGFTALASVIRDLKLPWMLT